MGDIGNQMCANCCDLIVQGSARYLFSSKVKGRLFTVEEALIILYEGRINISLMNEQSGSELKMLCNECSKSLGTATESVKKFNARRTPESLLGKGIQAVPTGGLSGRNTTPKRKLGCDKKARTPCKTKINKYLKHKRDNKVLKHQIQLEVRNEIDILIKKTRTTKSVEEKEGLIISDSKLHELLSMYAPLLYSILHGAMVPLTKGKQVEMLSKIRSVIGIMMNCRNRSVTAFQKSVGLSLYFGKASLKTFTILNSLGICCSYQTVTQTLDRIAKKFDGDLVEYKRARTMQIMVALYGHAIEEHTSDEPMNENDVNDDEEWMTLGEADLELEMSLLNSTTNSDGNPTSDSNANDSSVEGNEQPRPRSSKKLIFDEEEVNNDRSNFLGGIMTVDNINHVPQTLHYNSKSKPKPINMTSVAFIHNRIPQKIHDVIQKPKIQKAIDVGLEAYIPTVDDMNCLRNDHYILIKRILVKFLPYFQSVQNDSSVNWYIQHEYSERSKTRSKTINLGMVDCDGATTEGTKDIIKFCKQYFPKVGDNDVLPTVIGGDALTCDLIRSTLFHMSNSDAKEEKLEGPHPAVGQFHLRFCVISDIIKLFIGAKSKSPGASTLPSLRAVFGHNTKMDDYKHNFHLGTRFMDFCLTVYVCAFGMMVLNIPNENYTDSYDNYSNAQKLANLETVIQKILDFEWLDVSRNTSQERFCVCQEMYNKRDKRDFIACDNNRCRHAFWYHVECLKGINNKTYRKPPARLTSKYFCTKECEDGAKDKKAAYSMAFINAWLNFSGYRDAIRCNDGKRMNVYNKLHLIQFYNNNHTKYFRVCHMWQAQKAGWGPPNVVFDLLHNATVNLCGKKNTNFELDLFHEFINRYLKNLFAVQFGKLSKASLVRRSRSYQFLKELQNEWESLLREVDEDAATHNKRFTKWAIDIAAAVKILRNEDVLQVKGKRCHQGFPEFEYKHCFVENISAYRDSINLFARRLDDVKEYSSEVRNSVKVPE